MTKKQIFTKIIKLGYSIEFGIDCFILYKKEGKGKNSRIEKITSLLFNTEELPFCCGVHELGGLSIDHIDHYIRRGYNEIIKLFIQYAFIYAKEEKCSSKAKIPTGIQLIMISNGKSVWEIAEQALNEIPEHFTLVSTTRNGVYGNIIKLYIANH